MKSLNTPPPKKKKKTNKQTKKQTKQKQNKQNKTKTNKNAPILKIANNKVTRSAIVIYTFATSNVENDKAAYQFAQLSLAIKINM